MLFAIGNQFWKARSRHGRRPLYDDPNVLWDDCCEYFQWVEDNPLMEAKLVSHQGESKLESIPRMRAMTIAAMCLFIEMDPSTWEEYRLKPGFSRVTTKVDAIIYAQKFEGASADMLNANIIARDLGLKDKSTNEHTGPGGGPIVAIGSDADPVEASRLYFEMIKNMKA